jgi:hypothetical protein
MDKETLAIVRAIKETNGKLSDRVCLGTKELTLSASAQSLSFTGFDPLDVGAVAIKVKKVGSPADAGHLVRYTQALGDVPTTSHGMFMGDAAYFEVTNKTNVSNLKLISADGGLHILSIEYYGNH